MTRPYFDSHDLGVALQAICLDFTAAEAELNALDAALGDGDMGTTLASVCHRLNDITATLPEDMGACFDQMVRTIAQTSGSSLSVLAMVGLRRLAKSTANRTQIPRTEIPELIDLALVDMMARSGASLGDKTVLDALVQIRDALARTADPVEFPVAARQAARMALGAFRDKPSKIGRGRLAGDRSIGRDDPGMVAVQRMVAAMAATPEPQSEQHRKASAPES